MSGVREGLGRAMEQEPDYADGGAWLAAIYRDEFIPDYNPRPDPLRRAENVARRALDRRR